MPRLADLRRQYADFPDFAEREPVRETLCDESLVSDARSHLSTADVVDRKVGAALGVCFWILGGRRLPSRTSTSRNASLPTSRRVLPR